MQTHYDKNHQSAFIDTLRERAAKAKESAASVITAGEDNEQELASWKASNGVHCRHLPDDSQGILRLSIGGGEHLPVTLNYVVVRGKIGECIELLEKALVALRECPE
jgi:hypothetical protein